MEERSSQGFDYLPSLTGVRAVAALWVVGLHEGRLISYPEPIRSVFASGTAGVTLFFVLSGVVLTLNYSHRIETSEQKRRYLWARIARIVPVYLASLVLGAVASLIALHSAPTLFAALVGHAGRRGHAAALGLDATGLIAWVPWPPWRDAFNSPAWSVSTELAFYALFPFLIPRLSRTKRVLRASLLTFAVMLALNVVGVLAVFRGSRTSQQVVLASLYTNPLLRLPEFMLGCLVGLLVLRRDVLQDRRRRDLVLLGSLAWAVLLWASSHVGIPSHGPWILLNLDLRRHVLWLPAVVPGLLALASGPTVLHRLLDSRAAQQLGLASYSLYLLHWPLLQVLVLHQAHVGRPHPGAGWVLLLLLATIALSLAVHRFLEIPARRRILNISARLQTSWRVSG